MCPWYYSVSKPYHWRSSSKDNRINTFSFEDHVWQFWRAPTNNINLPKVTPYQITLILAGSDICLFCCLGLEDFWRKNYKRKHRGKHYSFCKLQPGVCPHQCATRQKTNICCNSFTWWWCAYSLARFKHTNHLVRVGKSSCLGLEYLFWFATITAGNCP